MREAAHLQGEFKTWTVEKVEALLAELTGLFARLRWDELSAVSCTVNLNDYYRIKRELRTLGSPEYLCTDFCVSSLRERIPYRPSSEADYLELFYDRDEMPFWRRIDALWRNNKERRKRPFLGRIRTLGPVADMRDVPGIQAADRLAWLTNRCFYGDDCKTDALILSTRTAHRWRYYDYDAIRRDYGNRT